MSRQPGGFTVVEMLTALLLSVLVLGLTLSVLARQRSALASFTARAEVLAAVRTARTLLGREAGSPRAWRPEEVTADSFSLRVFRGQGLVCPAPASPTLVVRPWGMREAVPGGDSVLVQSATGATAVGLLLDRSGVGGGCGADSSGSWERWRISAPVPPGAVVVRYFTRGSYHLVDPVLRFRTGGGGRQPLTPAVLDGAASGFQAVPGGVVVRLAPARSPESGWTVVLSGGVP